MSRGWQRGALAGADLVLTKEQVAEVRYMYGPDNSPVDTALNAVSARESGK